MKTLYNFIVEGSESKTKFEHWVSSFDELIALSNNIDSLNPKAAIHKDIINEFLSEMITDTGIKVERLIIYALGATYFRVPYVYTNSIKTLINSKYADIFEYKEFGKNKVKVYLKGRRYLLFETGSGSIGKISTEHQEQATCIVWNAFIEAMRQNNEFDINDKDFIKVLVKDLTENFDNTWIVSFQKQVLCIYNYITSIGKNPIDYKLCKYGDKTIVGKAYKKFLSAYTKAMEGDRKDAFDPTDVIIYIDSEDNTISNKLISYSKNPIESKTIFIQELFLPGLIQGISLKKIGVKSNGRYDLYNVGSNEKCGGVTSYKLKITDSFIQIFCEGNFNFDAITDIEGNPINNTNTIYIKMRTHGSGNTGIECNIEKNGPIFGKCPVNIWRKILGITKKESHDVNMAKFNELLNTKSEAEIKIILTNIIKGAIKEGEACFPYVLIH